MAVHRWRSAAKQLFYRYHLNKTQIKQLELDIIYGSSPLPEHTPGRALVPDPTAVKAAQLINSPVGELRRQCRAVENVIRSFSTQRRSDKKRLAILELVYFRRSHNLYQASLALNISERTAIRWNDQLLQALAEQMDWLE